MFTVQQLIDSARSRHWALADVYVGDGAVLDFLKYRSRTHLAQHGASIEGLVTTTMQYTIATVSGLLVALNSNGVPQYATTYQDGFAVHVGPPPLNTPYIDTSEAPVAQDPFGIHGGTPGFPLPTDFVRLVQVTLLYGTNLWVPCDVVPERERFTTLPGRNPPAFVSGNRLVPLFATSDAPTNDRWNNVSKLILSYVAVPSLSLLTDTVPVPEVLCELLVADMVVFLALQSPKMPPADRADFRQEALDRRITIEAAGVDMLNSKEEKHVLYRG